MSMIRTVSYKVSIRDDGSIFSESMEMTAEHDSMPLSQDQLDDARGRIEQIKQALLGQRDEWEKGPKQEAPKEPGQSTLEGGKAPANLGPAVKCIVCGTSVEPRTSQKGVEYSYCPKCKDNRRKDGTEFPPKKGA